MPKHLADALQVIQAHSNAHTSMESTRATVEHLALRAATESLTQFELQLMDKLERACGCGIVELAQIADTWEA